MLKHQSFILLLILANSRNQRWKYYRYYPTLVAKSETINRKRINSVGIKEISQLEKWNKRNRSKQTGYLGPPTYVVAKNTTPKNMHNSSVGIVSGYKSRLHRFTSPLEIRVKVVASDQWLRKS